VAFVEYATDYVAEEAQANRERRGIWGGKFVVPAAYRKGAQQGEDRPRAATAQAQDCSIKGSQASASTTCPATRSTAARRSIRAPANAGSAPSRSPGGRLASRFALAGSGGAHRLAVQGAGHPSRRGGRARLPQDYGTASRRHIRHSADQGCSRGREGTGALGWLAQYAGPVPSPRPGLQ
jgi:hypothetical protein